MLFEFLIENKKEIIDLCRDKILTAGKSRPTSPLLDQGLPVFYNELIEVLRRNTSASISENETDPTDCKSRINVGAAGAHGKESLRLGYTISQVVHAYGAVCQSITQFAEARDYQITPKEFHDFNLCLDCAIAEAVTEFEKKRSENVSMNDIERLGFLIHEMGNSLAIISLAHNLIQTGSVGSSGITSQVMTGAMERMRHLIHNSLAGIRIRGKAEIERSAMRLIDIISEVEATSNMTGKAREVQLEVQADSSIELTADRHLIFSAISNLVNNAIKFTKKRGHVWLRAQKSADRIIIEVEDECGGLPAGKTEELFKSFVKKSADKSGMGLGLSLSRQAIELNGGTLTVENIPDKGCIFTIDLPMNAAYERVSSPEARAPLSAAPPKTNRDADAPSLDPSCADYPE